MGTTFVLGDTEGLALFESLPRVEGLLLRERGRVLTTSRWEQSARFEPF